MGSILVDLKTTPEDLMQNAEASESHWRSTSEHSEGIFFMFLEEKRFHVLLQNI